MSKWPEVTRKGNSLIISDPPRGLGMIVQAKPRYYWKVLLILQRLDNGKGCKPFVVKMGLN